MISWSVGCAGTGLTTPHPITPALAGVGGGVDFCNLSSLHVEVKGLEVKVNLGYKGNLR